MRRSSNSVPKGWVSSVKYGRSYVRQSSVVERIEVRLSPADHSPRLNMMMMMMMMMMTRTTTMMMMMMMTTTTTTTTTTTMMMMMADLI
nr:hypothetical protein BaRGS_027926 [Batillaria attramentaria]